MEDLISAGASALATIWTEFWDDYAGFYYTDLIMRRVAIESAGEERPTTDSINNVLRRVVRRAYGLRRPLCRFARERIMKSFIKQKWPCSFHCQPRSSGKLMIALSSRSISQCRLTKRITEPCRKIARHRCETFRKHSRRKSTIFTVGFYWKLPRDQI